MNQSRIVVVTPVFNDLAHTLVFLESLRKQGYRDFTTVLVDMGTDDTRAVVNRMHPEVVVLKAGDILWAGGMNAGVAYAIEHGYAYVFTVNNDVTLEEPCLEKLVDFADSHPRSLVGSMVCYDDEPDRVWYFGGYFRFTGNMPHAHGRRRDFREPAQPEWLTGMGTLIPLEAYREVGFYDTDSFPQYFADADFSLRAQKEGGYSLWVIPDARISVNIHSSWLGRHLRNPGLRDAAEILFDRKSPMNLRARYVFYKKHLRLYRLKFFIYNMIYLPKALLCFARSFVLSLYFKRSSSE
jgi:GT2 family glycosyltransferase